MTWTPERENQLRELWTAGLSASRIAAELGGTTRNAVIGKAHRLGLSGRATRKGSGGRASGGGMRLVSRVSSPRVPRTQIRPRYVEPVERSEFAVSLEELNDKHCKWPLGDPRTREFHFCGGARSEGMSYCEYHCQVAYQVPSRREESAPAERAESVNW
jgi:GcrA cell cycle regulator